MTVKLALVYPSDANGKRIGGIETFLRDFIRYAPEDFDILHLGVSSGEEEAALGEATKHDVGGRAFTFRSILHDPDENTKRSVPVTLAYTWKLPWYKKHLEDRVLLLNRIEPAVVLSGRKRKMIGFNHNDLEQQLKPTSDFVWRHVPWLYRAMEPHVINRFKYVYTVNRNTLRMYEEMYPKLRGHMEFLPTWVDTAVFGPASSNTESEIVAHLDKIAPKGPRILFVGRIQAQKDPELLVDTFAEIRKDIPDAQFLVVGEGNLRGLMEDRARERGVADAVHVLGFFPPETLAEIYRRSNLFMLTSRYEGMPCVAVEAMGSGVPVVSTKVGEIHEVVQPGKTGEIVDSRDPKVIAFEAVKVLRNRDTYSLENCLAATEKFRPENILAPVYDKVRELHAEAA